MNRNTQSHFAELPSVSIGRSKFDRSFNHKTSFSTGELIPIYVDATIMPGDTINMNMSELVRMTTPITPVMDNIWMDTYFFFVPHRLVWDNWAMFMGENSNPWIQTVEKTIPKINILTEVSKNYFDKDSIGDYFGIPTETYGANDAPIPVNALPFRAYCKVWNDWFRDQNVEKELYFPKGDSAVGAVTRAYAETQEDPYTNYCHRGGVPIKVNKYHDYFTSCLPSPQKGPDVFLPLNGTAPIVTREFKKKYGPNQTEYTYGENSDPLYIKHDYEDNYNIIGDAVAATGITENAYEISNGGKNGQLFTDLSKATGASVTAIRQAFAIQKFYERQARGGTRYIEMIKSHFGVTNPDFRLQRSEYLGGKRIPISINQVVQTVENTSESDPTPLGTTGAYSVTSDISNDLFTHSFTEHGTVLGFVCVRTQHTYQQGLNAQWSMSKLTDFYFPEFANLSEMPVYNKELYLQGNSEDNEVFGYNEAYAHYRYMPDIISGALRSNYSESLDIWHYADYYESLPTLSKAFMNETRSNVDRTLAYQNEDQLIGDFYFKAIYTRPMPLYSIPGLLDHH